MIRVAIVDDEKSQIDEIEKIVSAFFEQKKIKYTLHSYDSGETLLSSAIAFELIFLDIRMGGMDGIETAQLLRNEYKQTALFYVTSYSDYVMRSMPLHPFAFIVKPIDEELIRQNLEDYLLYMQHLQINMPKEYVKLLSDNQWLKIDVDDILYFHYMDNRLIDVVTTTKRFQIKNSITKLYATLNSKIFLMPQQSFIVNVQHIDRVDAKNKALVMKNDDVILIARRKYPEFIHLLNEALCD